MCSEVDRNHPTITTSFPLLESFCLQDADLRLRQGEDTGAIGDATGKRSEPTPSGDCGWYTMDDPFAPSADGLVHQAIRGGSYADAAGQEAVGKAELSVVTLRLTQPPFGLSLVRLLGCTWVHRSCMRLSIMQPSPIPRWKVLLCKWQPPNPLDTCDFPHQIAGICPSRPEGQQHHLRVAAQKNILQKSSEVTQQSHQVLQKSPSKVTSKSSGDCPKIGVPGCTGGTPIIQVRPISMVTCGSTTTSETSTSHRRSESETGRCSSSAATKATWRPLPTLAAFCGRLQRHGDHDRLGHRCTHGMWSVWSGVN